jgi:hypothetical protein
MIASPLGTAVATRHWWHEAVFYQIYPRSFADGNGDGIGDLAGIIARLDYLASLGIEAIWLSPHYPSPLRDVGYDISDYFGVHPDYGSLEQFAEFLAGAHGRGATGRGCAPAATSRGGATDRQRGSASGGDRIDPRSGARRLRGQPKSRSRWLG